VSFFDGVQDCNATNGGAHPWGEAEARTSRVTGRTDYAQQCGDCGVTAWGSTPAEAMDRAREFDRANRRGGLW